MRKITNTNLFPNFHEICPYSLKFSLTNCFFTDHLMSVVAGHCFIKKLLFWKTYFIKIDTYIEFMIIVSIHQLPMPMPIERIISSLINAIHQKTRHDIITDKVDEASNSLPINWLPINKEKHLTIELFMNSSVTHKQICSPTITFIYPPVVVLLLNSNYLMQNTNPTSIS